MYLPLDDYSPYLDKKSGIFEANINKEFICINVYTNCVAHNDLITWGYNNSWEMLISEFSQAEKIIPCPRTILCNNFEYNNLLGDILNASDNIDDQENNGFTGLL